MGGKFLPNSGHRCRLKEEAQPGSLPCPQSAESSTQVFVQECAPGTQVSGIGV